MKNIVIVFIIVLGFISCKKEGENPEVKVDAKVEKAAPIFTGEFLEADGSAILQVGNETYKVVMNDACKELVEKSKAFKNDQYDFVKVSVKGEVSDNPNTNEWKKMIKISSVESVSKSTSKENITVVK